VNVVIATWQGGGASQPAVGLGRLLAERGHRVRIFAPAAYAERVAAAGCALRPFPGTIEFDPALGRQIEDQRDHLSRTFFGRALPNAVAADLACERADVIVIDYLLRSLVALAEQLAIPHTLLIHTLYRFHGGANDDDDTRRGWYEPVNAGRVEIGLEPLPTGPDSVTVALARRAGASLVVMPREYDDWPDPAGNVVHVGPIIEEAPGPTWESPWPHSDNRPLIVVSMGTTYMRHEDLLGRIVLALGKLDARVLVLTGSELAPEELAFPSGVHVRGYVPHGAVLPHAGLVVTHGGMGTLMAAFSAGVPVICIPLGRDQAQNARRVEELGLGLAVRRDATPAEIREAAAEALASAALHDRARHMASTARAYDGGSIAVTLLERMGAATTLGRSTQSPSQRPEPR
jgi:MGT family glycosyltransferase